MAESGDDGLTLEQLGSQHLSALMAEEPPEVLFHYTQQLALLSILKTGPLWASKVQYMNDSTEFGLALNVIRNVLDGRLNDVSLGKLGRELIQFLTVETRGIETTNICAVSFSADRDRLSQWRAYSGGSGGYAIGFRSDALRRIAEKRKFLLGRCIYGASDQAAIANEIIDAGLRKLQKIEDGSQGNVPHVSRLVMTALTYIGPLFKHGKFSEEHEWRLVTPVFPNFDRNLCFREGRSMLTPCYKIRVRQGYWKDEITHVTVGPCPHPELSRLAVVGLPDRHGIATQSGSQPGIFGSVDSRVTISEIPYRNW